MSIPAHGGGFQHWQPVSSLEHPGDVRAGLRVEVGRRYGIAERALLGFERLDPRRQLIELAPLVERELLRRGCRCGAIRSPVPSGAEGPGGIGHGRGSGDRFHPGHHRADPVLPLLERHPLRGRGIVHGLQHGAGRGYSLQYPRDLFRNFIKLRHDR